VLARYARSYRLAAPSRWAFFSLSGSPGARAYSDTRRARENHNAALRQLSNRLAGHLHGCLNGHTSYDEHTAAWPEHAPAASPVAAHAA